jgi:D-alanyl-D-alanine carboxypeptidase (penicillin-binding protein 5/6)
MSPHNVSTAVDLVKLGKIALEDSVISSIVATKTTTIPGIGNIENTNELLGIAGVMGIKTGTLDEAGACLLFASDVVVGEETVVVVGAVLGATTHDQLNARVRTLLTQAAAGFTVVELSVLGQSFATFSTPWGTQSEAVTTEAISAVVWSDTPALVFVKLKDVALAERKSTAGEVVFTVGERTIRSTLVLETAIEDPGVWWRLTNPVELL